MTIITYFAATPHGPKSEQGALVRIPVGDRIIDFVIQRRRQGKSDHSLAHLKSGYIFGNLDIAANALKLGNPEKTISSSAAALYLVHKTVETLGVDAVLDQLDSAPILNPSA